MPRSLAFYIDGLGFQKKMEWVHQSRLRWCALKLGGASVMLQEFWRDGDDHPANAPEGKLGQGLSICFICADALSLYRAWIANGLNPKRPFVGNGMWVVEIADPDGYALLFESETSVPEDTEYDPSVHG